ncbi:MAG: CDP-alcohol phosphatidyltransferase family protein [Candidatus Aadella gelida]|nr:CDP-alcohol phosphatidyltransferase family protein [Candidatus Aadella gelida]
MTCSIRYTKREREREMNWANRLTILRIVLTPVFIMAVLYKRLDVALVIFALAAVTDGLDGYIARMRKEKTKFGAIMDPIADKMLIGSAFVSFSLVKDLPVYLKMPIYVPMIIISRDVIILLGAMIIYLLAGDIKIKPSILGKVTTFFQMLTIIMMLTQFVYSSWIWNVAIVLTVFSGLDYIRIFSRQINEKL